MKFDFPLSMKNYHLVWLALVSLCLGQFLLGQDDGGENAVQAAESVSASSSGQSEFTSIRDETRTMLSEIFQEEMGENSWGRLLVSFVIILLTYIARKIVGYLFENWLHRIAEKTSWEFDDRMIPAMRGPVGWMVFVIGLFIALTVLNLSPEWDKAIVLGVKAATMTIVFWGILRGVDVFAETMMGLAKRRDMAVYGFIPLIQKATRTFLFIVAVILVVQNLGYSSVRSLRDWESADLQWPWRLRKRWAISLVRSRLWQTALSESGTGFKSAAKSMEMLRRSGSVPRK